MVCGDGGGVWGWRGVGCEDGVGQVVGIAWDGVCGGGGHHLKKDRLMRIEVD